MPIPRPMRTHKLARRCSSLLSRLDNPVDMYLKTLLINENAQRESRNMEYYNLFPMQSQETYRPRNTDCNCNQIRPMSALSVRSQEPHSGPHYGPFVGFEEDGWPFLPWKLQKVQVYIIRHLTFMWSLFMTNFQDESAEEEKRNSIEGCCDCALCRCLRRVPYGTLFAALLVAGGLSLLCYETLIVRDVVIDMFKDTALNPSTSAPTIFTDGYDILFWVLIAVVCVMGLFAILLLVFACFSTGSSGKNTCGKHSARCVGRFSTSLMIIATYGVNLIWLTTVVVMSMAFTFMLMVRAYCMGSVTDNVPSDQCLDLAQYGLVSREGPPTVSSNTTICGDDLKTFCDQNDEIHLCVYLIMVSCVVIVIGMVHFLMSLAANHTYLKVFRNHDPPRSKFGNDYRRTYSGNDYPGLQEPLNMSDETTRF